MSILPTNGGQLPMGLLTLTQVTKRLHDDRPLFEDVSLVVGEEDRIGLIGPNGAGKSTLLRLLAGRVSADLGTRVERRGLRIGFLEQEPQLPPDLTIHDAVRAGLAGREDLLQELEGLYAELARPDLTPQRLSTLSRRQEELQHRLEDLGGHEIDYQIDAAIDGVGLPDPHALCGKLSGGEARRVALARLLVDAPDLMLLDEPTNHLDAFTVTWLEKRLVQQRTPLVLVTHDRFLLDRVANRIVEIDRGRLFEYEGNYLRYLETRSQRMASEAKAEQNRQRLLKRETAWMRAGVLARATKAKARIDRYHSLASAPPLTPPEELEMAIPPGPRLGTKVLECHRLQFSYGENPVLQGLDLELQQGMRLGLVGPNGAGKTTLLNLLLGTLQPQGGKVTRGETVHFGTLDQRREDLDPEATVAEEVAGESDHVAVGDRNKHVASFLDSFLFPGERKFAKVGSLSGGERGRVQLAKLLLQGCNVLILDEPTNDLDLPTLRALEEALCAFPGVSIVVSHDRWFLDRVATHILHLDGSGKAFLHTGNVSSLFEREEKIKATAVEPNQASASRAPKGTVDARKKESKAGSQGKKPTTEPRPAKLSFKEKREYEALEASLPLAEERLAEIDRLLADPESYRGPEPPSTKLQSERSRLCADMDRDLERWAELGERA